MATNLDQKDTKGLLRQLVEYGLSEKEAQVYFALLPRARFTPDLLAAARK